MEAQTLPKFLRTAKQRFGNRVALREKDLGIWKNVTWNQYYENVKYFCCGIIALGLRRGEKVSILSENNPEWLYADLGTQSAGGICVGIYPNYVPAQVEYILGHSQSRFIVTGDQEQTDKVLGMKERLPELEKIIVINLKGLRRYRDPLIISFQELLREGRGLEARDTDTFERLVDQTDPEDTAAIVYTCGTTGAPKGAIISHRNAIHSARRLAAATPLAGSDTILSYLPLCHIQERTFSVFLPLVLGGITVNFAESVETVQEDLREIAPTIFLAVPRIWKKIYSTHILRMQRATFSKRLITQWACNIGRVIYEKQMINKKINFFWKSLHGVAFRWVFRPLLCHFGLDRARNPYSTGSITPSEILTFFRSIGLKIRDLYGLTECTGVCSVEQGYDIKIGTAGKIVTGVEIKIAEDGELLFRGDCLFKGYYRDSEATVRTVRDGWLYSGDTGILTEEGHLKITGRKKDIITTEGGKHISPREIENELKASPYIKDVMVIGEGRKYLTAIVLIEYENVGKWAEDNRVPYTTSKDLYKKKEVYGLVSQVIAGVNRKFSQDESVEKFVILDKELDQGDELTAAQEIRREVIERKYRDTVNEMYQ